jgi:hypothetical protein
MTQIVDPTFTAMCPHAGTVSMIPTNMRVKVGGSPAAVASDSFLVAGCTFVAGTSPAPCVMVNWMVTALRVKVGGQPVVTKASVGLTSGAAPPGPPNILVTQMRVKAQ